MIELPFVMTQSEGENFPTNLFFRPDAFNGRPGLVGTPGLLEKAMPKQAEVRGLLATTKGMVERLYAVIGCTVYLLDLNYNVTALAGTLETQDGRVDMAEGPVGNVLLTDGKAAWDIDGVTLSKVGLPSDILRPTGAGCVDSTYFLFDAETFRWYVSAANDISSWDALYFASKETSPDDIVAIVESRGDLYLFGEKKTEIWSNAGYSDFPWVQSGGGTIDRGVAAGATACLIDGTIFFLSDDFTVRRMDGYTPAIVSTHGLSNIISRMPDVSDAFAFGYYDRGDSFYVISFPSGGKTFVYSCASGKWHRWAGWNVNSRFTRHRSNCHAVFNGKNVVGDYANGKIYELSNSTYTDGGDVIRREKISQAIGNSRERFNVSEIEVEFKAGVGLNTGQGSDPVCMISFSKDKGRTWTNERIGKIGASGDNLSRAIFRRCGGGYRDFQVKVAVSDPVECTILGLWGRM